jgi:tetratricopeptide (TPR) repeat protein
VTFVQAGNFAEAESHYRQALPDGIPPRPTTGWATRSPARGRPDEAIAEFRKAIEVDPHFTPAYNNLAAEALAQQGRARGGGGDLPALAARGEAQPGGVERARQHPEATRQDRPSLL